LHTLSRHCCNRRPRLVWESSLGSVSGGTTVWALYCTIPHAPGGKGPPDGTDSTRCWKRSTRTPSSRHLRCCCCFQLFWLTRKLTNINSVCCGLEDDPIACLFRGTWIIYVLLCTILLLCSLIISGGTLAIIHNGIIWRHHAH
jgi:hypothetical protein